MARQEDCRGTGVNYYESLRSLEEDEMCREVRHLTKEDRADLSAYAYELGYAPGDIIDINLWCAWLDMLEARDYETCATFVAPAKQTSVKHRWWNRKQT